MPFKRGRRSSRDSFLTRTSKPQSGVRLSLFKLTALGAHASCVLPTPFRTKNPFAPVDRGYDHQQRDTGWAPKPSPCETVRQGCGQDWAAVRLRDYEPTTWLLCLRTR
jgi:hypothetical protein